MKKIVFRISASDFNRISYFVILLVFAIRLVMYLPRNTIGHVSPSQYDWSCISLAIRLVMYLPRNTIGHVSPSQYDWSCISLAIRLVMYLPRNTIGHVSPVLIFRINEKPRFI